MQNYVIFTDSTADLPSYVYEKFNIHVIPMEFIMDNKSYHHYPDAHEMNYPDFYQKLKEGVQASTTQINYAAYESSFCPILESGTDILYIAFSSGLSGTYAASKVILEDLMEKYPERRIISIDSLSASIGEGLLVYQAALKKAEGATMDELAKWVKENRLHVGHWFVVDDLAHLKRGGRISAIQAAFGTALNIKPLLSVDLEGKLTVVSKIRGSKKIYDSLIQRMIKDALEPEHQTVIIGHGNCLGQAEKLKSLLEERHLVQDIIIADIGPIIGTHTGAGILALTFMGQRDFTS